MKKFPALRMQICISFLGDGQLRFFELFLISLRQLLVFEGEHEEKLQGVSLKIR